MIRFVFLKHHTDFRVEIRLKEGKRSLGESGHWPELGHSHGDEEK